MLPLLYAAGDPDAEYLSEGIAESLINNFAELPKRRVAQRHKSFRYAGGDVDLQSAARELGVQAMLSGRILRRGETLVVKMELVDVENDAQVWGQQYTKHLSDIFALQDEIADEVLRALKVRLRVSRESAWPGKPPIPTRTTRTCEGGPSGPDERPTT